MPAQAAADAVEAVDAQRARNLAATCSSCHGTAGHSAGGVMATLAGRERSELLRMLTEFKAGQRPATIMQQIARGYSDAQLEQIATWFAAQR